MKVGWNEARVKNLPKDKREEIIRQMSTQLVGKVSQVTLRHDTSRAVQCVLQFGTKDQRKKILDELLPKIVEVNTFYI